MAMQYIEICFLNLKIQKLVYIYRFFNGNQIFFP